MEYPHEMAERLNELLQKNYDTEKQFRNAADDVEDERLKEFFMQKALQRYDFGHQLKSEISDFGESPDKGSGVKADIHRSWMDLKSHFAGNKEESVLEEVAKGEKNAVEDYNEVLSKTDFPPSTKNLLMKQRNAIKESLETVKTMESTY